MSNIKPDTPIWVLCTTFGDITDEQIIVKVHHHGANFYANLEDCKLDDPPDTLPSPVTKAKKVRYKRNKMKVGDIEDDIKPVEQANTIKFKVGDPVLTWGGRKGVVTDIDTASEHPIRVMLNPFSFVHCRTDQVTRGTPEIDSSMRQLNWNEVIQDGDVLVTINDRYPGYKQPLTIYAVDSIGKRVDDAFSKGKKLGLTKLFYRRIEKGTK